MTSASPWRSLHLKLPAFMGAVLLLVVAALTVLFYRSLERTLLNAAQTRLEGAAKVLGGALRPGFEQRVAAMQKAAARPEIAALLADPEKGRPGAAAALREAAPANPVANAVTIEVRGPDGACVGTYTRARDSFEPGGCVDFGEVAVPTAQALPIRVVGDTARLGVAAPIPGAAGVAPAGFLLERRPFQSAAAGMQLIEGLIGTGTRLYLANADGSVWTDLTRAVPAPYPTAPSEALVRYQVGGEERMAMASPLEGTPLVLSVEFPRAAVLAPADQLVRRALLIALVLALVGIAGIWLVSHRLVLPLRDVTGVAEQVAAGNLDTRITVARDDEVGRLARAFNAMADEVQRSHRELEGRVERRTQQLKDTLRQLRGAQDELVRKEKLATLGQLSSSVGHELRNPLGVMSNAVYFLRMVLKDPPAKVAEYLDILKQQISLSEKIVSDLLDFARIKPPQTQSVAVTDLLKDQLDRVGKPEGVEIVNTVPVGLPPVLIDRVQVGQVLFNLLTNAVQAMDGGGTLRVSAAQENGVVRLQVADTGTGIAPENLALIFDPLFTTKARGIGLGLSVARSLVHANRGDIEVSSEVGRGSTFTLSLPTTAAGAAA